jgi:hypothetical protein
MESLKIITKEVFTKNVIELIENKHIPAMEAVILFAEQQGLEIESVARLIDKSLKEKLESEAAKLHLLKKADALPI